ncbi:Lipase 3 [Cyphellophora attinorum]|uniref:Carboxylic ester hydrolase n=1 Tax=Cyphellophora attinorum TaxID=1664694 RepID=A0A0N1P311_9EURO|nr:Lipase 3 [Phialophora attinorum]KPI44794.1 Lipase 3 [Phialophora attinorum]
MKAVQWMLTALVGTTSAAPASSHGDRQHDGPVAHVKNGTYVGRHLDSYNQDVFLGIPFAEPPVGDLRFSNPVHFDAHWTGVREVKEYGPACVGYGAAQIGYDVIWIFGGAFVQGSGVDRRYNMSFMVDRSVGIGQPIMAVTLNYRLGAWGFLGSEEVTASGQSNFGLRDQRLALAWIQENIAAFGGDPSKVTIFGQSAGAASVGFHLLAFDGRDDGLFRSAIMQSGGPLALSSLTSPTQAAYDNLTATIGCSSNGDSLACLKPTPYEVLNEAINSSALVRGAFGPKIDGDFIARYSSQQLADEAFVHVPIIIGANSDEGTAYAPLNLNTTADFIASLTSGDIPSDLAERLAELYPDDPTLPLELANLPNNFVPNASYGAYFRPAATYTGDRTFIAGRRLAAQTWAGAGLPVWSYRFNAIPAWANQMDGVAHFSEVAFSMYNIEGLGYEPVRKPPFEAKPESYTELAELMSGDWVSFVASTDPNAWHGRRFLSGGEVAWPAYATEDEGKVNYVYDANMTSFVEKDDWRRVGIDAILSASVDVYER